MKLYTRTGDDGTTGLFGGRRVPKCEGRVAAYGEIDEVNAVLGWCAAVTHSDLAADLARIQTDLFAVGAELAEAESNTAQATFVPIGDSDIQRLEGLIDAATGRTAPLRTFILPGGSEAGARLHVARSVSRRAERTIVALAQTESIGPCILQYVNRLADLLFAWARLQNMLDGREEMPWKPSP